MKIGEYVKHHIKDIFNYCNTVNHDEFEKLLSEEYSKQTFNLDYAFCKLVEDISKKEHRRYWSPRYIVRGKTVRVTNHWVENRNPDSRMLFGQYLQKRNISKSEQEIDIDVKSTLNKSSQSSKERKGRYRGNAIGNAQNLLVRNILSNLGNEVFNEEDWNITKEYFNNRCAYCGAEEKLVMEHVVPINKKSLGEHRIGNIVPSCQECNNKKHSQDYQEFLKNDPDRLSQIEEYMDKHNYVPLQGNQQVQMILEMAYNELSSTADKYIEILNSILVNE